jgi:hypothetical protein
MAGKFRDRKLAGGRALNASKNESVVGREASKVLQKEQAQQQA